jgi:hypothetical protein
VVAATNPFLQSDTVSTSFGVIVVDLTSHPLNDISLLIITLIEDISVPCHSDLILF